MKSKAPAVVGLGVLIGIGLAGVQGSQAEGPADPSNGVRAATVAAASAAAARPDQGPGMRITFQSCGYEAVGLNVRCRNGSTGASNAQLLYVSDTSASSCAAKLTTACNAVGYRAQQSGDTTVIYGTGISVTAVGPIFTKEDF